MPVYRIDLSYDGSGFHGYARQPGTRTVQAVLEQALATVLGEAVETSVAGRTDAGVHALRQVVGVTADRELDPERLRRSLDKLVGPEIAVLAVAGAAPGFDARFEAVSRSYRYQILNRDIADPFRRHTTWHVPDTLDVAAMDRAAGHFVGDHDFASLCRASGKATRRHVLSASWRSEPADLVVYEVTGRAFCHQMVRSMVALCVEVGRGRLAAEDVPGVLAARDRNAARGAAPPQGLTLWSVEYP